MVNAAQGANAEWDYVNTNAFYYADKGIKFFGIPALDVKQFPLNEYFCAAASFISEELKSGGQWNFACGKLYNSKFQGI